MFNTIARFALIIGSAKSGTSSLFAYLAEHPEIAACSKKESQFFSNRQLFECGFEFYQKLWNWDAGKHQIALEATPNYARVTNPNMDDAPRNIAELQAQTGAEFKFIYIMRDPIARIESHYTHLEAWGQEPRTKPYAQGLSEEIMDVSKYAMQLDEYRQRFGADNILLLNFEDLKERPATLLRQVCGFLQIDDCYQFKSLDTVYNSNQERKKVFIPGWNSLRQTSLLKAIARSTPESAKAGFRNLLGKKVEQKIVLTPAEREYALNYLQEDLQRLATEYQVDISRWNLPQSVLTNLV